MGVISPTATQYALAPKKPLRVSARPDGGPEWLVFPGYSLNETFVPPALKISPLAARRFLRRALGLDAPHPDVGAALDHFGYIQIDPLNICGRMHDHILRHRVTGYREGDLMRHLHGDGEGHGVSLNMKVGVKPRSTQC